MTKPLTHKQSKFVDAFVEASSQTEAARIAGYKNPEKIASDLMKLDRYKHIREAVEKKQAEAKKQKYLTFETKKKILTEIAEDKSAEKRDRIRALDVDNKMEQLYVSRMQVETVPDTEVVKRCVETLIKWGFKIKEPENWDWSNPMPPI